MLTPDRLGWCIEIVEPQTNTRVTCKNFDVYEVAMHEMASKYDAPIEEVVWRCHADVPPSMMDEARLAMAMLQEKYIQAQ
jgi:hypothetical protein